MSRTLFFDIVCSMNPSTMTNTQSKKPVLRITLIALFAALIAGGSFVAIPLPFSPVPIVLQNLFIVLAGLVLGPVMGSSAVLLYLFAGAVDLPVFAGASGGIAFFVSPTGGFLIGYFFAALCAGLVAGKPKENTSSFRIVTAAVLGFLVVYIPGLLWLQHFMGSWIKTFTAGFFPFLIGDGIKAVIVSLAAKRLRRTVSDLL